MKKLCLSSPALLRISTLLIVFLSLPAAALDVRLTFQLPRSMGSVEAGFTGFDDNLDGSIKSSDNEIVTAWSSLTENWARDYFPTDNKAIGGNVTIIYQHSDHLINKNDIYGENEYFGLTRFIIETNRQDGNHVNSSGVTFRLDGRHPYFSSFGFNWSEVYNVPSNYSYSFEGPINPVRLVLETNGNIFATAVPEPSTYTLLLGGLIVILVSNKLAKST